MQRFSSRLWNGANGRPLGTLARLLRSTLRVALVSSALLLSGPSSSASIDPAVSGPSAPLSSAAPSNGRVIVLGFDGADFRTAQAMISELPNLARLQREGTFAALGTTTPDESPVAWASLNSGQNPGKTGVPGFIRREIGRLAPSPAPGHVTHEQRSIDELRVHWIWSFLGGRPPEVVSTICGVVTTLVFFAFLALLLRSRRGVALAMALVLGAVAAWAGLRASKAVPRVYDDIAGNPCEVGGFWEVAARAGVPCVVLDGAMSWDRPDVDGARVLSGLGVPDARGDNCDWFVYTTSEDAYAYAPQCKSTSTGGKVFRFEEKEGSFSSRLYGPRDLGAIGRLLDEKRALQRKVDDGSAIDSDHDRLEEIPNELSAYTPSDMSEEGRRSVPLVVTPLADGARARVTIGHQTQELALGQWSDWYSVPFEVSSLLAVHTVTRAKLLTLATAKTPLELYVDSVQYDPAKPVFWQPISQPAEFAAQLSKSIGGSFETVGWACLTMPLKDNKIDTQTFLEDIEFTHGWRKKLLEAALERDDWRVLMNVESTPDRVQHMMYRYFDREHPKFVQAEADKRITWFGRDITYADAIPQIYRQMDQLIGEVLEKEVKPGDTLIVCADHGFQSFRRQFQVNNWLAQEGYLVLRDGLTSADWDLLGYVDWEKTKAYSLGLGGIYINLKGREPGGIVEKEQMSALLDEIARKLETLEDRGQRAVHNVLRTDQIHSGPYVDRGADLMVGLAAGWRVAWKTTRGGIQLSQSEDKEHWVAKIVFDDNKNSWSGDHVSVADELVKGVFACNRKVKLPANGVHLLDIAPTVLTLVGVPVPAEYDHAALEFSN